MRHLSRDGAAAAREVLRLAEKRLCDAAQRYCREPTPGNKKDLMNARAEWQLAQDSLVCVLSTSKGSAPDVALVAPAAARLRQRSRLWFGSRGGRGAGR